LLFLIFLNPILKEIEKLDTGYHFYNNEQIHIPVLAFADDIALISDSRGKLRTSLSLLKEFCKTYGMQLSHDKTKYTFKSDTQIPCPRNYFVIDTSEGQKEILTLQPDESYKYLGIKINLDLDWKDDIDMTLDKLRQKMAIFKRKCLTPELKVELINMLIMPIARYHMTSTIWPKDKLKELNDSCLQVIKYSIPITKFSSNEQFWAKKIDDGLNLKEAFSLNHEAFLDNYLYRNLLSLNDKVKQATIQRFKDEGITKWLDPRTVNKKPSAKRVPKSSFPSCKNFVYLLASYNKQCVNTHLDMDAIDCVVPHRLAIKMSSIINNGYNSVKRLFDNAGKLHSKISLENLFGINISDEVYQLIQSFFCDRNRCKKPVFTKVINCANSVIPTRKFHNFLSTIQINAFTIVNGEFWICTDGSSKGNTCGGWGLVYAPNSPLNTFARTKGPQDSLQSELEPIEAALLELTAGNIRFFVDCKEAIKKIQQAIQYGRNYKKDVLNGLLVKAVVRRIVLLIEKYRIRGYTVEFEWIPSHFDDKMRNYSRSPTDYNKALMAMARFYKLNSKFGKDNIARVKLMNELAHKNACTARSLPQPYFAIPPLTNQFFIVEKGNKIIQDKKIGLLIKKFNLEKFRKTWELKDSARTDSYFNKQISNLLFKSKSAELIGLKKFLLKMRNKNILGAVAMRRKLNKARQDIFNLRIETLFPDNSCGFCGHFWDDAYHEFRHMPERRYNSR
jgi:hypothetical protein